MDKVLAVPETHVDKQNVQNVAMLDRNRRIYSDTLFAHGDEVFIQHRGEQYRLRRTRNGKLILTK
ncbi:MAG: hemin uptake protein HemP [Nitrosospira sp.]|nr:hemin uptake protein HemP [Nitrosospira sp.]